jgi:hypothetical protein
MKTPHVISLVLGILCLAIAWNEKSVGLRRFTFIVALFNVLVAFA